MRGVITVCEKISGEFSVLVEREDVELVNALLKRRYEAICDNITADNHNHIANEVAAILKKYEIPYEPVFTYFIDKKEK